MKTWGKYLGKAGRVLRPRGPSCAHRRRIASARSSSGTVMMEFVIAFPLLVVLMLGIFQFAQIWSARQVVHYAAFCAARAALVTVCGPGGGSGPSSHWPRSQDLPYAGLAAQFCQNSIAATRANGVPGFARTEAEWAGNKAAAQVCSWIVMGSSSSLSNQNLSIPKWGSVPGSGSAERKTRAVVEQTSDWNIRATVEHDFALITPIVGPMIAWGLDPWSAKNPWLVTTKDVTGDVHAGLDDVPYPHIRLTETVWLPKPYQTIISAGYGASGSVTVGGSADASGGGAGGYSPNAQDKVFDVSNQMAGRTVIGIKVTLKYEAFGIPDDFEIIYDGRIIGGTGGLVSGGGTITKSASGSDTKVTIRVNSNSNSGTAWNWTVKIEFIYQ